MRTGRGTSQQKKGTERAGRQCDGSPLSTHRDSRGPNAPTTAIGGSSTHTEEPPATASPSSSPPPPPPAPSPAPSRSANSSDAARNLTEVQSSFIFCFFLFLLTELHWVFTRRCFRRTVARRSHQVSDAAATSPSAGGPPTDAVTSSGAHTRSCIDPRTSPWRRPFEARAAAVLRSD